MLKLLISQATAIPLIHRFELFLEVSTNLLDPLQLGLSNSPLPHTFSGTPPILHPAMWVGQEAI